MISSARNGWHILRQEGVKPFISELIYHVKWRYGNLNRYFYWKLSQHKGYLYLSSNGYETKFVPRHKDSITRTLRRFRSEKAILNDLMEELEHDDVFYDIGANTGLFTCFAEEKCIEGQVVAFEPYPSNVEELRLNTKANDNNTVIIPKALSNEAGSTTLSVPDHESPGFGKGSIGSDLQDGIEIETVIGDELIHDNQIPSPNIVKIDVEGAEYLVVDGLTQALNNRDCRVVYCEIHRKSEKRLSLDDYDLLPSDLISKFESMGYDVKVMVERDNEMMIKAQR